MRQSTSLARWYQELHRFVIVGVATFLLNLGSFYFFMKILHLDYRIAVSLAYLITVLCHFTAHRLFTFQAWEQALGRNALKYACLLAFNYSMTVAVTSLIIGGLGLPGYVAVLCYTACNAATSFLAMKYIVFRHPARQTSGEPQ